MKRDLLSILCLSILFIIDLPSPLQASELININGIYYDCNGEYYIEKDEKGLYLRTDKNLSWYLNEADLGVFKPGEKGFYYLEIDASKPFILTDKKRVFYIDQEVAENLKKKRSGSDSDREPIENIKGFDKFYTNGRYNDHYITPQEARKRIKGQPTLEWERKKVKAELEAIERERRNRPIREAERARREAERARREAEWEAARLRGETEEARGEADRVRREAEWARQEAEEARQKAGWEAARLRGEAERAREEAEDARQKAQQEIWDAQEGIW